MNATANPPFKLRMPHTLVLVWLLVAIVLVASWYVPSGEILRREELGRLVTVPGTFHAVPKVRLGIEQLWLAPIRGFALGAPLIAFLFVIAGAFAVLRATGAVEAGIRKLAEVLVRRPALEWALIPTLMTVFSLAGSIFGLAEGVIPFVVLFIPLARRLGYDAIVGVSIPFLGAAAGFAAAFFNPFTVGIAQQLSGLPPHSGMGYRVFTWFVGTAVMITYVMVYARRVKRNPALSPMADLEREAVAAEAAEVVDHAPWNGRHAAVMGVFVLVVALLSWGMVARHWGFDAIAALFLAAAPVMGFIGGIGPSRVATTFVAGAKDMVGVACIVACARALLIIGNEAHIMDTLLHASATLLGWFPRAVAAQVMFLIQAVINFFIHSGSGQAALTMPIMAPLSDLLGITRQTAVFAFQLCEFINPILPTSAVTMGILGAARIPWDRWAKWFLPLMAILVVLSFLLLIPPVLWKWGPF